MQKGNVLATGVAVCLVLAAGVAKANIEVLEKMGSAFAQIAKEALPAVLFSDVETTIEVPQSHYRYHTFEEFFGRSHNRLDVLTADEQVLHQQPSGRTASSHHKRCHLFCAIISTGATRPAVTFSIMFRTFMAAVSPSRR